MKLLDMIFRRAKKRKTVRLFVNYEPGASRVVAAGQG